jgi:hypothetical protein
MPAPPRAGAPHAWRVRLDYGKDVAGKTPRGYWARDAFPALAHRNIALFGEVEDYRLADHYLCYKATDVTRPRPTLEPIDIVDQFHSAAYAVNRAGLLCTPADKNSEGVVDRETHLKGYTLKRLAGEHLQPVVDVANQFGTLRLHAIRESHLLVPSSKRVDDDDPPQPDPLQPGFEHYMCYKASVEGGTPFPKNVIVEVSDQFGFGKYLLRKPTRICAPASKKRVSGPLEPIRNGLRHLVCYSVRPIQRTSPPDLVHARNQFGLEHLKIRGERELCVPSVKTPVDPPPPPLQ